MANPLQRGTKQYPNGTNVPRSGTSNNRGPAGGLKNNRPVSQSTSTSVNSSTYQPFPSKRSVAGVTSMMSASEAAPDLGSFKSPIRKSLAKRKAQGPTRMMGNQGASSKQGY